MKRHWIIATALVSFAAGDPARACMMSAPIVLKDVRYADVVLVGRIANYRIVRDEEFRRKMLSSPNLTAGMRSFYESGQSLLSDYAGFDIEVDEVLVGTASNRVAATWDNSTFGEPEGMPAGPFLIALRRPSSAMPPLRGPSATIVPNREPQSLTVLQAPCSDPFIFEAGSDEARKIRRILNRRP